MEKVKMCAIKASIVRAQSLLYGQNRPECKTHSLLGKGFFSGKRQENGGKPWEKVGKLRER